MSLKFALDKNVIYYRSETSKNPWYNTLLLHITGAETTDKNLSLQFPVTGKPGGLTDSVKAANITASINGKELKKKLNDKDGILEFNVPDSFLQEKNFDVLFEKIDSNSKEQSSMTVMRVQYDNTEGHICNHLTLYITKTEFAINSVTAEPQKIYPGDKVKLSWECQGAEECEAGWYMTKEKELSSGTKYLELYQNTQLSVQIFKGKSEGSRQAVRNLQKSCEVSVSKFRQNPEITASATSVPYGSKVKFSIEPKGARHIFINGEIGRIEAKQVNVMEIDWIPYTRESGYTVFTEGLGESGEPVLLISNTGAAVSMDDIADIRHVSFSLDNDNKYITLKFMGYNMQKVTVSVNGNDAPEVGSGFQSLKLSYGNASERLITLCCVGKKNNQTLYRSFRV